MLWIGLSIFTVVFFKWVNVPFSSFIIQRQINIWFFGEDVSIEKVWVPLDQISPNLQLAVIASEDQNFPNHWGIDLKSINIAIEQNKNRKHPRGASTITQQTAKNLFLWSGKSFIRKGLEAYFTLLIEIFWSKERILEVYLNIAEFGNGIYGAEAASKKYMNKSSIKLSISESALFAAVLPNPKKYKINAPSSYIYTRVFWIADQMAQLGGKSYLKKLE